MDCEEDHSCSSPVIVWLIDDNKDFRLIARKSFQKTHGKLVLVDFDCCEQAIETLPPKQTPNIILLDIGFPYKKMGGIEALKCFRIRLPDTHIIMLTIFEDDEHIFQAIEYGAKGYVVKSYNFDKTFKAITDVLNSKRTIVYPEADDEPSDESKLKYFQDKYNLTNAETEYVRHIVEGHVSIKQLADTLCRAIDTVKFHLKHIYEKMGVNNITELVFKIVKEWINYKGR